MTSIDKGLLNEISDLRQQVSTLGKSKNISGDNFPTNFIATASPVSIGGSWTSLGGTITHTWTRDATVMIVYQVFGALIESSGTCNGSVAVYIDGTLQSQAINLNTGSTVYRSYSSTIIVALTAGSHTIDTKGIISNIVGSPSMSMLLQGLTTITLGS